MLSFALVTVLAAGQMKVSAPAWKFTGIEAAAGEVLQSRFLSLLGEKGDLEIVTAGDIAQILGMERQRQLLGCDTDASNCMAELAGAIGADAVVTGSVARAGSSWVVTLRGLNAVSAKPFASATTRLESEQAVLVWLENEAGRFGARMRESFDSYVSERDRVSYTYKTFPWFVIAGGALTAALGGVSFGASRGILTELRRPGPALNEGQLIQSGQLYQDGGVGLMIAGGVVMGAGLALLFATRETTPKVTLVVTTGGAILAMGGAW